MPVHGFGRLLMAAALTTTALLSVASATQARTGAPRPAERPTATGPTVNQSVVASTVSLTSTSAGRDFWMAFPQSTGYTDQSLIVYVAGREAATGRISIRDNTFDPIDFTVTPGQVTKLELPGTLVNMLHPANATDGVSGKGIHLTATADVNVYGLDYESKVTDAYQAIPSHAAGKDHVISGYFSMLRQGPSRIVVVAQEDDTQITVTARANTEWLSDYSDNWANPWPVFVYTSTLSPAIVVTSVITAVLNAGQVYQHTGARDQDLSGSEVQASKPVVVLGQVGGAYVPMERAYADQLLETMPPVPTWGKRYIGMPSKNRAWGDTFRIYAAEADTTVRVNGGDPWNIGRGQWIEYRTQLTDTKYFVADKPIMVQQYMNGTEMDNLPGDPSMLTVASLGQGMTSYLFATPKDKPQPPSSSPPYPGDAEYTNTVNVLMPDVAGAAVYVDGVQVTGMTAAQDSGFLYASVSITPGTHAATGTVPFQVTVYGLRKDESYAYAAGSSYLRQEDISSVSVTPEGDYLVQDGARCFTATALSSASPVSGATAFLFDGYGKVITSGVTNAAGEIAACHLGQPGERGLTAMVGPAETTANVNWMNDDASLINLESNPVQLFPTFVSTFTEYLGETDNALTTLTVTLSDPNAHYTITSSPGACTPATGGGVITVTPHTCALYNEFNYITVTVVAEDGLTTQEYTAMIYAGLADDANLIDLAVSPGELAPAFVSDTTSYTVTVPDAATSMLVTPTLSDPTANYTVTGGPGTCVGTSPATCTLSPGANLISVTVTAEDWVTTKEYVILVRRPHCFAEVTGDNTTDYISVDSQAVRDAVAAANDGDVVKLAGTCAGVVDTRLVGITKTLTLRGGYTFTNWTTADPTANPTVLDGAGAGRVIIATAPVTIENVTIQNGSAPESNGGGVYAAFVGDLTISGTQFLTNTSQDGGGLYVAGNTNNRYKLFLTNTVFISNTATRDGGGIWTGWYVDYTVSDSRFVRNVARGTSSGGGALYAEGVVSETARIENTLFEQNESNIDGGALYISGGSNGPVDVPLELVNTQFVSNVAGVSSFGGALSVERPTIIVGSVFTANRGGRAGAIYASDFVAVTDTNFISNTAYDTVGAAYGGGARLTAGGSFSGGRFEQNTAVGAGGALLIASEEPIVISGTQFLSNTGSSGGGLYIDEGAMLYLTNTQFVSNTVGEYGGAVYASTADYVVSGSYFTRNVSLGTASSDGGGAFYSDGNYTSIGRIQDTVFEENTAAQEGGALRVYAGRSLRVPLELLNTRFVSNTAGTGSRSFGGAAFVERPMVVSQSTFIANAAVNGGAVYVTSTADVTLTNNLFVGNEASALGSDVYARITGRFDAQHTTFVAKTAGAGGAVVNDVTTGGMILTNSLFFGYATGVEVIDPAGSTTLNGVLWDGVAAPTSGTVTVNDAVTGSAEFADAEAGDYMALGAAVDAGVASGVATDIRGAGRPIGAGYDLGAYEAGDAMLIDLKVDPVDLVPAFVSTTTAYTAAANGVSSVTVTPTLSDPNATYTITGSPGACAPTTTPAACALAVGVNVITVTVRTPDGTTEEYVVEITRAPSSDASLAALTMDAPAALEGAWVSTTTRYTANVPAGETGVLFAMTPSVTSTLNIEGNSSAGGCDVSYAQGEDGGNGGCTIDPSGTTVITLTVTAEDGTTTKDYVIVVNTTQAPTPTPTPGGPTPTPTPGVLSIENVWPRTGVPAGGMPVAVLGSGFTGATGVTVDGAPVPFTVTNDGRIDIVMPPGTDGQRVDIAVTTPAGTATAVQAFTYVAPAVFEVEAATGGVLTTTGGVTVVVPAQPGVSGTLRITVEAQPPAAETPGTLLMHSFVVSVTLNGQPFGALGEALTLTLEVDPAVTPNGETPTLYVWTIDGGLPTAFWVRVPGQTYDSSAGQVRGRASSPGRYVVSTVLQRGYWFPIVPVKR